MVTATNKETSSCSLTSISVQQLAQAHHVIDEIHDPDLERRPLETDRTNEVATHLRLRRKDVFDSRTHFGLGPVRRFLPYRQQRPARALFMDLTWNSRLGQPRFRLFGTIGTIRIHRSL